MKYLLRKCEIFADANVGKFVSNRPTEIIHYSSAKRLHYSIFICSHVSSRLPFPATLCRWRRLRAFTERPYGQTDKPHTVGRGLAPAETFGDSLQPERLTKSRRGELRSPISPMRCCSTLCQRQPPCPLRPVGAPPPRGGGLYMGRFVNRPYLNSSLFTILSSLFT